MVISYKNYRCNARVIQLAYYLCAQQLLHTQKKKNYKIMFYNIESKEYAMCIKVNN